MGPGSGGLCQPHSTCVCRAVAVLRCSQVTLQMPMSVPWRLYQATDPRDYQPQ